jgi:hypothetical protein
LPTDWSHNDREQVNRAREAAEALFKPKEQVARAEASSSLPMTPSLSEQPAPRTPRVIAIPSMTSVRDPKVKTAIMVKSAIAEPKPPKPRKVVARNRRATKVPASEFARIRTLAECGMTLEQLAENYGVSAGEIERIVGLAVDGGGSATLAAD